jgi:threonine aldolase
MYQGSGYGSTRTKDTPALEVVDLRSDTVTQPTAAMRRAMAEAKVGDDVYGEDPTVTELEFYVQQILEKEAALYFPSSTMSNLAASMAHCHAGNMNEVIIGSLSHQAMYEVGNLATLGRIFPQMVETNDDGTMDLARLQRALKPLDVHCTTPRLICLENTHCFLGGRVLPLKFIEGVRRVADDSLAPTRGYKVAMHLDGARLWNAAVAAAENPQRYLQRDGEVSFHQALRAYAAPFDSVSVCLSKGLGAPVGAVLAGDKDFIGRARHVRKMLGGGMRQAGVVAAAGLHAVHNHWQRLREDHVSARQLSEGLGRVDGIRVLPCESNMCLFRVAQPDGALEHAAASFAESCAKEGLLISTMDEDTLRMVPNLNIESGAKYAWAVEVVTKVFQKALQSAKPRIR